MKKCLLLGLCFTMTLFGCAADSTPQQTPDISVIDTDDFPAETHSSACTDLTSVSEITTQAPLATDQLTDTPAQVPSTTIQPTEDSTATIQSHKTVLGFLKTAGKPLGSTMYVWGGGWNEANTGAGVEACSIGISPRWSEFAVMQSADYDYHKTRYQIHDGLDCSGYVGWAIYNTFEQGNGCEGYVMRASVMAENFARRNWGSFTAADDVRDYRAGDIMSGKGHVWICIGECADGSVVMMHSSPPGVILSGTRLKNGDKSQAVLLAEEYMKRYFPEWFRKYPDCSRPYSYLSGYAQMRWNRQTLEDPEGICSLSSEHVLALLFDE